MPTATARNSLLQRLLGAAALDIAIYEEVEADPAATPQAFLVVLASSLAAGIGIRGYGYTSLGSVIVISTLALLLWVAWVLLIFEVGTRLMPQPQTRSSVGELLRTIGFASTPGLLRVLGVLPGITTSVFVVTAIWMLAAMIVAVRRALDFQNTSSAIAVCIVSWVLVLAIALGIGFLFTPPVS